MANITLGIRHDQLAFEDEGFLSDSFLGGDANTCVGVLPNEITYALNSSSTTPPANPVQLTAGDTVTFKLYGAAAYQHTANVRIASTGLFTNFTDVIGLYTNNYIGTVPSSGTLTLGSVPGTYRIRIGFSGFDTAGSASEDWSFSVAKYLWITINEAAPTIINPDTSITQEPSGAVSTASSTFTKTISNANSNGVTDYRLLRTTGTDTEYDIYTGSQTSFTLTGSMPSSGSWTYVIQARVPTANNGDNTWVNVGSSFTVTKVAAPVVTGSTTYITYNGIQFVTSTNNVWLDDQITIFWNVDSIDYGNNWIAGLTSNVVATPSSGDLTSTTETVHLTFTPGNFYDVTLFASDNDEEEDRLRVTGTISDPWLVGNNTFTPSSDVAPNVDNVASSTNKTLVTARSGETVDFSVSGGSLEKNNSGSWVTSGTITDGDTYKLRGNANNTYGGTTTVTTTFSKYSNTKGSATFVVNTEDLIAPTDLSFVDDNDNSATEQVTVTASGGNAGTIKVSNDNSTWYANGTKFDHTRGSRVTYYSRREGLYSQNSDSYSEGHTVYPKPPTDITFVNDGDASATEDVAVTASGGYGGTLQVSSDGTNWYANGTKFDQSRDSSVTYSAKRDSTYDSSSYSEEHTVNFIEPDTEVASSGSIINRGDTEASSTLSSASDNNEYEVRLDNGTTAVSDTLTGDGTFTISSSLPTKNSITTYEVFVKRPTTTGGDGVFVGTDDTFTIGRYGNPTIVTFGTSNATPAAGADYTISGTFLDPQSETITWSLERKTGSNGTYSEIATGTGDMSVAQNVVATTATTRYYRVKISALDSDVKTSAEVSVSIPAASLSTVDVTSVASTTPNENSSDAITATTTTNTGVAISSYSWSSTGAISFSATNVKTPTITFGDVTQDSSASVTVTVTDSLGRTTSDTQSYTIQFVNQGPSAALSGTQAVLRNELVELSAAASEDPDGLPLEYQFSTTNGSQTFSQPYGSSSLFSFTPTQLGVYTTTVTVRDSGSATATALFSTIVSASIAPNTGSAGGYGFEVYNALGHTVVRNDELMIRKVKRVVLDSSGNATTTVTLPTPDSKVMATGASGTGTLGNIKVQTTVSGSTATVTLESFESAYGQADLYIIK